MDHGSANAYERRRRLAECGGANFCALMLALALLFLVWGLARTDESAVAVENRGGDCGVHGAFIVHTRGAIAWEVLTDYDGLSGFVTSMHSSRVEQGDFGRKFVRQEAVAKVFFIRRRMRVLLEIQEVPKRRIGFQDVLGKDFRSYVGAWKLSDVTGGTKVEYELVAVPRSAAGRTLCRKLLRDTAQELLEQVRAEMLRRGAKA